MKICKTKKSLLNELDQAFEYKNSIGFVPTMGALHQGHISLIERSLSENEITVVSIFVNPTQFNKAADLKKYPRTFEADIKWIESLGGKCIVYAPEADELYNGKIQSKKYSFSGMEFEMEGKFRKGHFDGVGTVLNILFRTIKPNRAYFGEKDFQQLQIVKKLVEIEHLPISIIGCPIIREKNGLAMSSRNQRLSEAQMKESAIIYKTLKEVKRLFSKRNIQQLKEYVKRTFEGIEHFELEYFEIAGEHNLKTAQRKNRKNTYRAFIAVYVGNVRLIDNIRLN